MWCRLEDSRWRLGSLSESKCNRRPRRPKLLDIAGHRGENYINRDILHILTRLSQEEIDYFNGDIFIKEIEFLAKNTSTEKTLGPDGSIDEFYQNVYRRLQSYKNCARKLKRREYFLTQSMTPALLR